MANQENFIFVVSKRFPVVGSMREIGTACSNAVTIDQVFFLHIPYWHVNIYSTSRSSRCRYESVLAMRIQV